MKDDVDLLIEILFDPKARIDEKDDAAMYLADYPEQRVINALLTKGKDVAEDDIILNSCGESLGQIWTNQNQFDKNAYHILSGTTRYGVYYVFKSRKPEWVELYKLNQDNFKNNP
jgi:hypothetical protein